VQQPGSSRIPRVVAIVAASLLLLAQRPAAATARYAGVAPSIAGGDAPNTTSVLVMRGGAIEYERYFAGTGPETLQDPRSVGKSITALAVGVAIERGAIPGVTAQAFAYLKDLEPKPDPIKAAITIEDLLTMSSALDCNDDDAASPGNEARMYPRRSWAPWAAGLPVQGRYQRDASGRGPWHYCTAGSFLLGQILERATRQPADRFIAESVLRPIGITRWQFNRSPTGEVLTGGQLRLRTRDLAALGWLVRSRGRWKGRPVVPEDFVRKALTIHRQTPYFEEDYGYQLWRHTYQSPCGQLTGWQMSGNGGNKVVIFDALDAVVVVTRTHYNQRAAMHLQSTRLIEGHILPDLCRAAGKS
jgi:CubicO group peptidase (beta-lactamase class C family)